MISNFKFEVVETLFHVKMVAETEKMDRVMQVTSESHETVDSFAKSPSSLNGSPSNLSSPKKTVRASSNQIRSTKTVGRNQPCPCGSGKKFKHCHGKK